MISGVSIVPLKANVDERGYLMEILRESDPHFTRFAQVYVSKSHPGVIRAWHYHAKQTDIWCVVSGKIKTVMYDMREGSPTKGEVQEVFMGDDNRVALVIPVGVAHGYKALGESPSLLLNFTDFLYNPKDPDEYRLPWNTTEIAYNWDIKIT
jgi:dTDP-4-dehydrorhamnose 3,5-epimerase